MTRPFLLGALLPWLVLAAPSFAAPIYDIQTFTVPGAASFNVSGINNSGQVVGTALDAQFNRSGFIETIATGAVTIFNGPTVFGSNNIEAFSITDAGTVFGTTGGPGYYLRGADGTFTTLPLPNGIGITVRDINNSGQVIGSYLSRYFGKIPDPYSDIGVLLDSSTGAYTTVSALSVPNDTRFSGINNFGQVVGTVIVPARPIFQQQGFLYDSASKTVTLLAIPNASFGNALIALNDVGQAIGSYSNSPYDSVGYLLDLATGSYTVLPFIGTDINNAGQIVGNLRDSDGQPTGIGFIATPEASGPAAVPEPGSVVLLATVLIVATGGRRRMAG